MYPKVSINIVVWNSMSYIPDLMKSIMAQTYQDFNVVVIDNGSTDGVAEYLRENYPNVVMIRNARNLGFAPAQNQGIRYAVEHWNASGNCPKICDLAFHGHPSTPLYVDNLRLVGLDSPFKAISSNFGTVPSCLQDQFILVTNPDIIFTPTYLEELMAQTQVHPHVGSFGGKLLRAFGENLADEVLRETIHSDRIDSTGLNPHKNFTVTDRGAGELDQGQYDTQENVFGLSGALVLYRGQALLDARYKDEFFDDDFFAYKEDVDLAWRLQQLGWDALYVPQAKAYHYRGMYGVEKSGLFEKVKNWRRKSSIRNYYSTRNQWLMLIKNVSFVHGLLALPWFFPYEFARFVYVIIFDQGLRASIDALRFFSTMLRKRRATRSKSTRAAKEIRRWFV